MAPAPDADATFSHDVAVAAITRYYQFLERISGPSLKYPPEGGWPQITPDLAEHQNLSPEALRLIREIPYFTSCPPYIVPECHPNNYPEVFDRQRVIMEKTGNPPAPWYEGMPYMNPEFPPHIFELAEGGYRMGSTLAIDTKRGVAIWHNMNEESLAKGAPEPDAPSEIDYDSDPEAYEDVSKPRGWRAAPTYRIETFFAMAEEQLKLLNWIPKLESSECPIDELRVYGELDMEQQDRVMIMRDAGWPDDDWDRLRAMYVTSDWSDTLAKLEGEYERMRRFEAKR